ncbi:hypothetical protein PFISCL1PPCAC_24399 [Pristionchus fissidentatus]|uniref:EF-hand domain-containing protein n=1 Tax=Pristionchus fissidentatus TaxID=1538716 RepID=A0AAV5WTM6_9BILA|nr:hypothetical protein PFISCL1PPCAC_24399 [Pristionchus fissidentatus]
METFSEHFALSVTDENVNRLKERMREVKVRDDKEVPILSEGPSKDDFVEGIRREGRRRLIHRIKENHSNEEDLEVLTSLLQQHVSYPIVDGRYLISYTNYRKVRDLCPSNLRSFLTDRLFEALRADLRDHVGRVEVKRLMLYCHKRLLVNHHLLMLHEYARNEQPFLNYDDFQEFLTHEIVPNIIGLQDAVNEHGESIRLMDPNYYLVFVEKKVQFLLDPLYTQKIRIVDLMATGVLDDLLGQFEARNADDLTNRFSIAICENILSVFRDLDVDINGLLSEAELALYNDSKYSSLFISNVFLTEKTFDDNQIDFTGFINFYNAVEYKRLDQSMRWMFRVLDRDSKGFLTREDIIEHIESLMAIVQERAAHIEAKIDDVADEVFDICKPVDPTRITIKDVLECGKGATVMGMITNLDDYITYETREDQSNDPDQE